MLLKIREIVSGWVAAIIVVLLIIPFAFWGINYYFGSGGNVLAIEVNDADITLQEFQRAYQETRQRWQTMLGVSISAEQDPVLKQTTVDNLIDRELIRQINESLQLRIGDRQLTDMIKSTPQFQGINGFDNVIYEQLLSRMGYNSARFEAQMRADMASAQLQNALLQSTFVTSGELERLTSLIKQKRDFSYAILSSSSLKDSIEINEDEITNYYNNQGREFINPEQVKIAYVDLSLQRMADAIEVDDGDLRAYFDQNTALYQVEDQRKFQHLFMPKVTDAAEDEVIRVRQAIEGLHGLITGGKTFAEAVAASPEEISTGVEIIDQDYMTRGIMEPEVDEVLFGLNTGEVSNPIETEGGFHILRLEEIKGGLRSSFEEVREQVEQDYRLSLVELEYADAMDQLTNLAFEQPDTLAVISDELGLPVYESDFFDRQWQPDDLLRNTDIVNASFSDEVLLAGNNSEPIEIDDNRFIVLRVVEHKPETKKPLEEVRDRIVTRIKFERARDETRSRGEALVEDLRKNAAADEAAAENGFVWQRVSGIKRDAPEVDGPILNSAFRLGRPQPGEKVYGGTSLASGDYAIIIVEAVQDGGPDDMMNEESDAVKGQLEQLSANDIWMQLLKDLKTKSVIHVYSNNL